MPLYVNNQQAKVPFTAELSSRLLKLAAQVFLTEGIDPEAEVGVLLVDDGRIRELNLTYRGIDAPTDVLSFAMMEQTDDEPEVLDAEEETILGDIIISMERAVQQAEEYGHGVVREVGYLMVHGFLHLMGYDHQQDDDQLLMRSREEEILAAVDLPR